ncbi:MAG: flavin reductase [Prevotellaceae bacterium]|jgi:flavin reductase (DIM6/NTAB) family NADH-FMN oxidoreductase RutF|nr:flavin reductase [Prevotellaceae bacterium]
MKKILVAVAAAFCMAACSGGGSAPTRIGKKEFRPVAIDDVRESLVREIEKGFLLTAGNDSLFNTMTAGWGTIGHLWTRDVVVVFVRPQRYTFSFLEREKYFTLSFLSSEYNDILQMCGVLSGRNTNKIQETGLLPIHLNNGAVTFKQAYRVVVCKKLYNASFIDPKAFVDPNIVNDIYPNKDFHHMFVGEIVDVLEK